MTIQSIEADNSENIPNCNNKKKNKPKNILHFQSVFIIQFFTQSVKGSKHFSLDENKSMLSFYK
jgi:hypothetical protein